ncbi:unnamed protein product [Heterobilharzia americana]|nr:unnamed protein product [Heterobilharzia americana]
MMPQEWSATTSSLVIGSKVVECANHFTYLEIFISSNRVVGGEILARIQKARLTFANSRHVLHRLARYSTFHISEDGYTALQFALSYGCEAWLLKIEDIERLQGFDHGCLRNTVRV